MFDYVTAEVLEVMGLCRCCLRQSPDKNLKTPYTYHGKTEIYLDMLKDSLDIHLDLDRNECGICSVCVGRLRDASEFKQQVQRSQVELRARLDGAQVKDETPSLETGKDSDNKTCDNLSDDSPDLQIEKADSIGTCHNLQGEEPVVKSELADDCDDFMLYYADEEPANNAYSIDDSDDDAASPLKDLPAAPSLPASLSTAAKQQLAMTCSVRLERIDFTRVALLCHICHRTFLDPTGLETHVNDCRVREYTCDTCGKRFKRKSSFEKHVQTHMKKETSEISHKKMPDQKESSKQVTSKKLCNEICSLNISGQNNQINAKIISDQNKTSNKSTSKKISAQKRLNEISSKKISYQKKSSVEITSEKLSNQKNTSKEITCKIPDHKKSDDITSKKTSDQKLLNKHENNTKLYTCKVCNKRFAHKNNLNNHTRLHKGERIHACKLCNKTFTKLVYLNRHSLQHSDKPFSCKICNKDFVRLYTLQKHQLIHKCSHKNDLKRQQLTHSTNKVKSSKVCKKNKNDNAFNRLKRIQ